VSNTFLDCQLYLHDKFSSGQLVIVDIMLGHYVRVEKPMEKDDDITDITMTDKHVILYNNKYYRQ